MKGNPVKRFSVPTNNQMIKQNKIKQWIFSEMMWVLMRKKDRMAEKSEKKKKNHLKQIKKQAAAKIVHILSQMVYYKLCVIVHILSHLGYNNNIFNDL